MRTANTHDIPLKSAAGLIHIPAGVSRSEVTEIRLRSGRRACVVTIGGRCVPCSDVLSREDIESCFQELCRHSVHSFSREIAEGYITLPGGHRVGFCGTAVIKNGALDTLRDISCVNIRIARQIKGCAEELFRTVFSHGTCSLLLAGAPLSGKTTMPRDLARLLGEKHRVALIDSRSELAAVYRGTPALDVGENTDVLCGYPKYEGIMTALRTLSPEVIICDEIGGDADAVKQCMHCGVKLIASAHAGSLKELSLRPDTAELLPLFDCAAVLGSGGRLAELQRNGDTA